MCVIYFCACFDSGFDCRVSYGGLILLTLDNRSIGGMRNRSRKINTAPSPILPTRVPQIDAISALSYQIFVIQ